MPVLWHPQPQEAESSPGGRRTHRLLPPQAHTYLAVTSIPCAARSLEGDVRAAACPLLAKGAASCKRAGVQLFWESFMLDFVAVLPWVSSGHRIASGRVPAPPRAPLPSLVQVSLFCSWRCGQRQILDAWVGMGIPLDFVGDAPHGHWVCPSAAVTPAHPRDPGGPANKCVQTTSCTLSGSFCLCFAKAVRTLYLVATFQYNDL